MASARLTLPACAKLNLFLHITGRRQDGYHNLQTIFQLINLCDTLTFESNGTEKITLTSTPASPCAPEQNLVYRAAQLLRPYATTPTGMHIHLYKQIPGGGGLGGGSSDAATTLVALNRLWQCRLDRNHLLQLGSQLGADVAIFIHGQTSWAEGTGNIFMPVPSADAYVLILHPAVTISTAELFAHPALRRDYPPLTPENYEFSTTENAFEKVFRAQYPSTAALLDTLLPAGRVRMSGTGSCFFILCRDAAEMKELQRKIGNSLDTLCAHTLQFAPIAEHTPQGVS